MGHKISKEQIDPGVKDYIMSFVGDINELETDDKSNIINAVNSLMVDRVDNAENMGKLANAIGEPVTANHSVDEVVEGLGEMLSTFKTNMMNSGVVVESSDKFKSLIDKIKGLTEGEGNKGVQFAEGDFSITSSSTDDSYKMIQSTTPFKPDLLVCYFLSETGGNSIIIYNSLISSTTFDTFLTDVGYYNTPVNHNGGYITDTGFLLPIGVVNITPTKWYAIGIGEEDTTLRDSLASILEEEGVSVTEEDDMASLITKVDEEFDRKNANSGLDIISATELPDTGKENQICVITDNPVNLFYITSNYDDVFNNDDGITLYVGDSTTHDGHLGNLVTLNTANVKQNYYIYKVLQGHTTRLSSYIYRNSQWEQLTQKSVSIMEDKVYVTGGNFIFNISNPFVLYNTTYGLQLKGSGVSGSVGDYEGHNRSGTTLKTLINFSDFNKIRIKAQHTFFTSDSYGEIPTKIVAFSGTNSSTYSEVNVNAVLSALGAVDKCEVFITEARNGIEPLEFEIDITNWSGSYYLGFAMHSDDQYSGTVYISDIELY